MFLLDPVLPLWSGPFGFWLQKRSRKDLNFDSYFVTSSFCVIIIIIIVIKKEFYVKIMFVNHPDKHIDINVSNLRFKK